MVPGNWHKLSPMYLLAVPFEENRPICLVSSDAHIELTHTQAKSHTYVRPIWRCRVDVGAEKKLFILRSAYSLPAHRLYALPL